MELLHPSMDPWRRLVVGDARRGAQRCGLANLLCGRLLHELGNRVHQRRRGRGLSKASRLRWCRGPESAVCVKRRYSRDRSVPSFCAQWHITPFWDGQVVRLRHVCNVLGGRSSRQLSIARWGRVASTTRDLHVLQCQGALHLHREALVRLLLGPWLAQLLMPMGKSAQVSRQMTHSAFPLPAQRRLAEVRFRLKFVGRVREFALVTLDTGAVGKEAAEDGLPEKTPVLRVVVALVPWGRLLGHRCNTGGSVHAIRTSGEEPKQGDVGVCL
mmetsp:Transcript_24985/g.79373  ORF Transcript_24985/g.79373 Transcript_24985/m.79373 type:complete len:271 (+) Transcript_24985:321-1133(+)